MRSIDQSDTDWRGDVPVSRRYGDPYYSLEDGAAETRHVFLDGNGLPQRFRPGFHIAELGFGTGLNMLCAWRAWNAAGIDGRLRFTSFEKHPLPAPEIARALGRFPDLGDLATRFVAAWSDGSTEISLDGLDLTVEIGDAADRLESWSGRADAWFLDGFAPARNPELWSHDLMAAIARVTAPGGTFATYTAAGHVRRSLAEAGFAVERCPGYGRKRHMTKGILG